MSLNELTDIVAGTTRELECRIIEAYVEDVSSQFFESDERRKAGIISRNRTRKTAVLTSCGMVYLENDVYEDQNAAEGE